MNKDLVKRRFARTLDSYAENAKIQKQMAEKLLTYIDRQNYDDILEIGCGCGLLTQLINNKLVFKNYIANDIVPDCKTYMKSINSDINFISGDIEKIIKNTEKKFDLIISNASFQWIENLESFTNILMSMLNPDGVLIFSTFGCENFREIYHAQGVKLHYYSVYELKNILKNYDTIIEEEIRILAFKNPKEVLKHIKQTGVNSLSEEIWTKRDLKSFENCYNNFCSGNATRFM